MGVEDLFFSVYVLVNGVRGWVSDFSEVTSAVQLPEFPPVE